MDLTKFGACAKSTSMDRTPVISSNVKSVGYDPAAQLLEVEFMNGGVYQYKGVPPEAHQELMEAGSIGSHLASNIKGLFETVQVAGPQKKVLVESGSKAGK